MGTFDDSKIRKARKPKNCVCCRAPIEVGEQYLSYQIGLRNMLPVRLSCARSRIERWRCAALLAERHPA